MAEKEIFTVKTLAEYLSVNTETIYNYVKRGTLPHFRMGNHIRFRKKEIDEWIDGEMKTIDQEVTRPRKAGRPKKKQD